METIIYSIKRITISELSVASGHIEKLRKEENLRFTYESKFAFDDQKEYILVILTVLVFTTKDDKSPLARITVNVQFEVKGAKSWIDKDKLVIPKRATQRMVLESVATTRGILLEKLRGTILSGIIVPPLTKEHLESAPRIVIDLSKGKRIP